jgi:4-carboxymuconolactone decarboxylase
MSDRRGRADLHIHTLASDGVSGVAEILDHVQTRTDLDVIAITDHERIDGALRAAELGDEPGGEEFLARMGPLGDWVVDFAFGDVHTRPGLDARERELIIVAVLATLGSSDPQVRAHVLALRALGVPWQEIEECILQITPYAGVPRAVNAIKVLRELQEEER